MTRSARLLAVLLGAVLIVLLLPMSVFAAVPIAQDDSVSVAQDAGPTTVDVLQNNSSDAGPLVITDATDGANGAVTFDPSGVTYTPDANYNGLDTFTYTVSNDDGPASATVHVTVTAANAPAVDDPPANEPPVANPDFPTVAEEFLGDGDRCPFQRHRSRERHADDRVDHPGSDRSRRHHG